MSRWEGMHLMSVVLQGVVWESNSFLLVWGSCETGWRGTVGLVGGHPLGWPVQQPRVESEGHWGLDRTLGRAGYPLAQR